jgi:hypothetical protein
MGLAASCIEMPIGNVRVGKDVQPSQPEGQALAVPYPSQLMTVL